MPLRIGCDLDGVLADMESELVRHARELFGDNETRLLEEPAHLQSPPAAAVADGTSRQNASRLATMGMTERQERRLWRHVEAIDGFWETLKEIEPGAVARLAELASARRWELIFLTKRPESAGATAQLQTQRWLQACGFSLPSVFVVQGSRGRVAAAFNLDVVVDDRPENCLDVVIDSTTRAVLVWREDAAQVPAAVRRPGVQVVSSMAECLAILEEMDRPITGQAGLIGWLKRRLGVGRSSAARK